jgi:hypothetical protein
MGVEHVRDENLPVAELSAFCRALDGLEDARDEGVGGHDLDQDLRHEVDHIRGPSVDLLPTAGSTKTLDLVHGHSRDARVVQRLFDLVELRGPDNRFDFLHVIPLLEQRRGGRPFL